MSVDCLRVTDFDRMNTFTFTQQTDFSKTKHFKYIGEQKSDICRLQFYRQSLQVIEFFENTKHSLSFCHKYFML